MQAKPYSVEINQLLEQIKNVNTEIIGMIKQKSQFENIVKEIDKIIDRIKKGELKTVYIPSVGNILTPVKANDKDVIKMYLTNKEKYNTGIKGIEGQMNHRQDLLNELTIKLYRHIRGYVNTHKLKIPKTFENKYDEQPDIYEKEKKDEKKD